MAVDSRNKRFSLIGFGIPVPSIFPDPDGDLSVYDMTQYLWLYAGLSTVPPVPSCRIFTIPFENRTFSIKSESRVFPVECFS